MVSRRDKSIETENRIEAARGWEGGRKKYCLIGTEFCWGDKHVLGFDSGDGCTTL